MKQLRVLEQPCCAPGAPPLAKGSAKALAERFKALSAGSRPEAELQQAVVEALEELDIDVAGRKPKAITNEDVAWADIVVTMGCGDACPVLPGKKYIEWNLVDPVGLCLEEVRELRDDIARRVAELARA